MPETNIVELAALGESAYQASAREINLVIPYYGYARSDKKFRDRTPVMADIMAAILSASHAKHVFMLDVHSDAAVAPLRNRGMIPDTYHTSHVTVPYIRNNFLSENWVTGSPDKGGIERARKFDGFLGRGPHSLVIFDKYRPEDGVVDELVRIFGDVDGKKVGLIDDIIASADTVVRVANAAVNAGATDVVALAAHGLFTGNALDKIADSPISKTIVTDTIPYSDEMLRAFEKARVEVLSTALMLAMAIRCYAEGKPMKEIRKPPAPEPSPEV